MFKEGTYSRFRLRSYTREFKHYFQRLARGWDDSEIWSLDYTISQFVLPRLKGLKKIQHGYPSTLSTMQEWEDIMDKMILAFELNIKIFDDDVSKEERELMQEGLDLFAEYYCGLWD
jgi:hypothetical protein